MVSKSEDDETSEEDPHDKKEAVGRIVVELLTYLLTYLLTR